MGLRIFLLYILLVFMRPVDWLLPWLAPVRPLAVASACAFVAAFGIIRQGKQAAVARHYWLLAGLSVAISLSVATNGWVGGVPVVMADFSTSALLFLLVSFFAGTQESLRKTCVVIVVSMVCLAALSIYSYHTGYMVEKLVLQQANREDVPDGPARPSLPSEDVTGAFMWRIKAFGFFDDPNDFGQSMVMTLPFIFLWFTPGRRWRNLALVWLPAAVLIYGTYLTNSRGALLGLGSLTFFQIKERLGNVKSGFLLGGGALGALALNFTGGRGFSAKEESAAGRIEAWFEGFQMLKSHPLFGVGYGQFTEHHWLTAHNSFVLCFAELGLVGYFFWMALVVSAFQAVFSVAKHAPAGPDRQAAVVFRSSIVGFFVCTYFLSRTYQPVLFVLLALCVASWVGPWRAGRFKGIEALQVDRRSWLGVTLWSVLGSMSIIWLTVRFSL
ncbi:MAG: hypothetical protein RI907_1423 [Pseudomonadota bacterium]|jgi:cell division protein FtsW (lipid II flippase)